MLKKMLILVLLVCGLASYAQAEEKQEDQPDSKLTKQIREVLREDQSLQPSLTDIQLKATEDGAVFLRGTVGSREESEAIEGKVRTFPGVARVHNDIMVKGT